MLDPVQTTTTAEMAASTTMTIRMYENVKPKIDRLANNTRRSRSFLAAAAVSDYMEREPAIIDGVQQSLADTDAGPVVPHDQAMDGLDAAIESANPDQQRRAVRLNGHVMRQSLLPFPSTPRGRALDTYEQPLSNLPYTVAGTIRSAPWHGEVVTILRVTRRVRDWPTGERPEKISHIQSQSCGLQQLIVPTRLAVPATG